MLYSLNRKQKLPITLQEAWDFMSAPGNLSVITPPDMGFVTLSGDDRRMYPGQIIHYTVTPLLGIKLQWVTEITHVIPMGYFVDEQRHGPYKLWHHKHFMREIPGGVEMEDLVHYKIPMGIIGRMAHPLLVRPKLEEVFDYREKKLKELFGEIK